MRDFMKAVVKEMLQLQIVTVGSLLSALMTILALQLDAAFFHLYGLSRDDTAYVMDTFPIVRKNDEKAHGEYRTSRLILEIYDELAEAIRTGRPYQTRLDPPPADPRVAHPPREQAGSRPARAR